MSERTTSDQEFVRLFSPKILERLPDDVFDGAVHIFRSPPGGGKTTLLRAFTPPALRAFWNARRSPEMSESHQRLVARGVLDEVGGPRLLGVLLSCASGYADLPPGASSAQEGLFRALLDSRIVLRAIRSLGVLLGLGQSDELADLSLDYSNTAGDLKHIPLTTSAGQLMRWANERERAVYAQLDALPDTEPRQNPNHLQFEGVLWLEGVKFLYKGEEVGLRRLLMIDDLHKLRRRQRSLLIGELAETRHTVPVWLAERSIALGEELLSQGVRQGRELRHYPLEEMWSSGRGHHQFATFAQNVLDRRLDLQSDIPPGVFSQYLRGELRDEDVAHQLERSADVVAAEIEPYRGTPRYAEWLTHVQERAQARSVEALTELIATRILIARDQAKRQLSLELGPLGSAELAERDSSQVRAAAEIFVSDALKIPYYFGIERLCVMATSNVDELLSLASALYDGVRAKIVLRRHDPQLSPSEQEKLLKAVAKARLEFIPKSHTEGTRAQRLLDAIGSFCRTRTFLPNAPYAPGVTGIRLSQTELSKLSSGEKPFEERNVVLRKVLAECVAENLLVSRGSAASSSRESGTVFYLNRGLCAHYGLPLQMGGWQDVAADELVSWMEHSRPLAKRQRLEMR